MTIGAVLVTITSTLEAWAVPVTLSTDLCAKSVSLPSPLGESDLKGNPKLAPYCACFNDKFTARLNESIRKGELMKPVPVEQSIREAQDMRNSCRAKMGLPLIDFSKDPSASKG